MTAEIVENPVNRKELGTWTFILMMSIIIANLLISLDDGFVVSNFIIVLITVLAVFICGPWKREFYSRPPKVEIIDTGIILHRRYWREPRKVPWSDITDISMHPVDPEVSGSSIMRDGRLWVGKGRRKRKYVLEWNAAKAVKEAYREHMDEYPYCSTPEDRWG